MVLAIAVVCGALHNIGEETSHVTNPTKPLGYDSLPD